MNIKKIVLRTVPYVCIALYGTKIGQAWRLAAGTAFAEKFLHWGDGFMQALASLLPSFYPQDVLTGMAIAMAFYAAVYVKGKNAKKFRHNVEYGSARWGTAKDIEPYVDPAFANNIILTQTERLTMNSRPK
ncbi:MAG: type IV secretory system conjugative DNA transfer family protein, partial [Christensenellales bacterium]